ncbi:MAG: hypothetical protein KC586_06875 [Myxococcales bacterium]|nr:hypothetical protein [Myxococcales bacterium]
MLRSLLAFGLVLGLAGSVSAQEGGEPWGEEAVDLRRPNHEEAQDAMRLSAYFPLHGSGEMRVDYEGPGNPRADLGVGVGLGVRFELPVWKYLSIGALWELLSFEVGGFRDTLGMDFDVMIKGRYVFGITTRLDVEAYGFVPLGLSWMRTGDGPASIVNSGVGFNTGFQGGATAIIDGKFGIFTDLGVRVRRVYSDTATGTDVVLRTAQLVWSLGGVLLF